MNRRTQDDRPQRPLARFKALGHQMIRFGFIGGISFLIDYGVLFVLTSWCGLFYLWSNAISFTVSTAFNYTLSVKWVFDVNEEDSHATNFSVFLVMSVIGLGLNQLLMWLFVSNAGIHYMIAKIIATAIVMVYNFITRKLFLERNVSHS